MHTLFCHSASRQAMRCDRWTATTFGPQHVRRPWACQRGARIGYGTRPPSRSERIGREMGVRDHVRIAKIDNADKIEGVWPYKGMDRPGVRVQRHQID